jgi:hypothetical protein
MFAFMYDWEKQIPMYVLSTLENKTVLCLMSYAMCAMCVYVRFKLGIRKYCHAAAKTSSSVMETPGKNRSMNSWSFIFHEISWIYEISWNSVSTGDCFPPTRSRLVCNELMLVRVVKDPLRFLAGW